MSKRSAKALHIAGPMPGKLMSSSLECLLVELYDRHLNEPKVRKAERPSLLMQRTQNQTIHLLFKQMVEPIGIEPMT
jgi:hypothetical protein|tara:strand:- start:280 stop:510 length:231 start_codon:yes stop_codon:yes gene_type:complete